MNVLVFPFDIGIRRLLHEVLEMEEHNVTIVERATDVIRALEDASDSCFVLVADNMMFNQEAIALLSLLRDRPDLRPCLRIIASDVSGNCPYPHNLTQGLVDDYLIMPFSVDELLDCLEANAAKLPR